MYINFKGIEILILFHSPQSKHTNFQGKKFVIQFRFSLEFKTLNGASLINWKVDELERHEGENWIHLRVSNNLADPVLSLESKLIIYIIILNHATLFLLEHLQPVI